MREQQQYPVKCGDTLAACGAEEEVERRYQGMDRPGVRQVPDGSGEYRKMEETGCELICGAPTTLGVKGQVKVKVSFQLVFFFFS